MCRLPSFSTLFVYGPDAVDSVFLSCASTAAAIRPMTRSIASDGCCPWEARFTCPPDRRWTDRLAMQWFPAPPAAPDFDTPEPHDCVLHDVCNLRERRGHTALGIGTRLRIDAVGNVVNDDPHQ